MSLPLTQQNEYKLMQASLPLKNKLYSNENSMLVFFFLLHSLFGTLSGNTVNSLNPVQLHAVDSLLTDYTLKETILCEGFYPMHLQGISTDKKTNLYWSFTDELVRTDLKGKILNKVNVLNHHGDLCYQDGKIYVAVNLGKFNRPAGEADSWVFVYDSKSLKELARYPVPELVHGAGGISFNNGLFYVVGGLPIGFNENYIYTYDKNFNFLDRHVIASGYTRLGIQTIEHYKDQWWLGCYGSPKLLKTNEKFQIIDKNDFDISLGIVGYSNNTIFVGTSKANENKLQIGSISVFREK